MAHPFYAVPPLLLPPVTAALPTVETLSQYEAVQLYIERALLMQPAFQVTNRNAPAIAQICHRLDGIPLALELAAARVKALPVEKIAERLEDRFRLLNRGNRTALPHHQTLRALVDWRYDLLSEPERVLLRRLAIFGGGWTLEAAESSCSGAHAGVLSDDGLMTTAVPLLVELAAEDVLALLTRLVEKSLVIFDEQAPPRYRLLETIRQYAAEKLTVAQETQALGAAHFQFFAALVTEAEPLFNRGQRAAYSARLAPEQDNLRAALTWAQAHDLEAALQLAGRLRWFWLYNGHLVEARTWYSRLLTPTPLAPPAVTYGRGLALLGAGLIDLFFGALRQGVEWLSQSRAIWEQVEYPAGLSEAIGMQSFGLGHLGEFTQLCTLLTQSETQLRRAVEPVVLAYALSFWGWALSFVEPDSPRSQTLQEEALAVALQWQDDIALPLVYLNLGHCAIARCDYATTRRHYTALVACQRQSGMMWMLGISIARTQLEPADFEQAWTAGQTLTLDGALALVQLSVNDLVAVPPTPAPTPAAPKPTGKRQRLGLSARECEVAVQIAQGHSNRAIAAALVLSERTVENHVANILNKLGFTNRSQIAAWVVAQGVAKP